MTTYGHFTLKDYEARKDNPFLEQYGHCYRITETYVIRALDRVNYQAEECDPREVEAWKAEQTAPEPEPVQAERFIGDAYETPVLPKPRPRLADYARQHGWPGVGRISNTLKEAYKAEFGE